MAEIIDEEDLPPSWEPVDAGKWLKGPRQPMQPTLGHRSDGVYLFYPGKTHTVFGDTESGKSWLMLYVSTQEIEQGHHVWYIDFEDSADTILGRLLTLTDDEDAIARYFHYVAPAVPLWNGELLATRIEGATLVTIDGVTEALSMHDSSGRDEDAVAKFGVMIAAPLAATGAAVVTLDHVVKSREAQGRNPIGSVHKLNSISGAAYRMENREPFGRGRTGISDLYVAKDRPGYVRQLGPVAKNKMVHAATLTLASQSEADRTEVSLDNPSGDFRPTTLMERISRAAKSHGEPVTKTALVNLVEGNKQAKMQAVDHLVSEGFLAPADGSGTRKKLVHVKLYLKASDQAPILDDI